MANIKELLNKTLEPVFKKLGKINLNSENILGVSIKDKEIQAIDLIYKKKSWQVKDYIFQQIAGIGKDQDIYTASTYLSDQVKNALSSINSKATDVAITLDKSSVTIFNLQIPIMEPNDLRETVALGGFWEQFDETPESLEEFETSYQIISSNEELGVMNVMLVTIEKKLVEAYVNIFRLAGFNPVIIDINPASQMNAMMAALGKEGFETPIVIFNYTKDSSYISIASNKGFAITDVNIIEADQVLLDTIEDVDDVATEFWDEIFDRLAAQIKQSLVEFETQNECEPISLINVVTDRPNTKNLFIGLEKQLGDVVIKQYDPEESINFLDENKKYLDALSNKSKTISAIGSGIRRLNAYNADYEYEKFDFNLLPRADQLKINRKSKSFAKYCYGLSFVIFLIGSIHLIPFRLFTILDNSKTISDLAGIMQDVESKENIIKAYQGKVQRIKGQVSTLTIFGENKKTTAELIASLSNSVPKNVRLTSFKIDQRTNVAIDGVSKDDPSVITMMNSFSNSPYIEVAKLVTITGISDQDKAQLYTEPGKSAPKSFPNESISKKFTVSLNLKPIEDEMFDKKDQLERLVKAGAKKRRGRR